MQRILSVTLVVILWLCTSGWAQSPITWQPLHEPGSGGAMVDLAVSSHDSKRLLVTGDMLGIGFSTDGGDSWQSTFGLRAWECGSVTFHPRDPNVVWVGMVHGPHVSRDGGKTWAEKRGGMPAYRPFGHATPIEKILFHPQDEKQLFAIAGSSRRWDLGPDPQHGVIWHSTDAGENWTRLCTFTKEGKVSTDAKARGVNLWFANFTADGKTLVAVADGLPIMTSADFGKSWLTHDTFASRIISVALHPKNADIIYVATDSTGKKGGSVYHSEDRGRSFVEINTGLLITTTPGNANLTSRFNGLAIAASDPSIMYVSDTAWNRGIVYKSVDAGKTWRPVLARNNLDKTAVFSPKIAYFAGTAFNRIVIDPKNADIAYAINQEFILRTRDGGKTWDDATSQLMREEKDRTFWRGRGYSGLCARNFDFNPYKQGQSILQGMDAARAWLSDDNLTSWTYPLREPNPWFGGHDATFAKDGTIFITSGQYGFWGIGRLRDGGKTWQLLHDAKHGLPKLTMGGAPEPLGIHVLPSDSSRVFAVVDRKLAISTDSGDKWTITDLGEKLKYIVPHPRDERHFYITSDRGVFVTTDAGKNFAPIGGPKPSTRGVVDSKGRLYVVAHEGSRGGLYRFADNTWSRLHNDKWIKDVAIDPRDDNRLLVTTNQNPYSDISLATGVWLSADAGKTWQQENAGLAMTRGTCVAIDPFSDTIIFGSFGRGFFKATWPRTYKPVGRFTYTSDAADADFCRYAPATRTAK